jgi:hypothetical protein
MYGTGGYFAYGLFGTSYVTELLLVGRTEEQEGWNAARPCQQQQQQPPAIVVIPSYRQQAGRALHSHGGGPGATEEEEEAPRRRQGKAEPAAAFRALSCC